MNLAALEVAREEMESGAQEVGGNNLGEFVKKYHGRDSLEGQPWCASFLSWCYLQAAQRAGVDLPFKTSGSARALFKNIARAGEKDMTPRPGDAVLWKRGSSSWQGHIGIVVDCDPDAGSNGESGAGFVSIEGNSGSYSKTRGRVRQIRHSSGEDALLGFARLKD